MCTTRKQTGVGYPQLSAVLECADSGQDMQRLTIMLFDISPILTVILRYYMEYLNILLYMIHEHYFFFLFYSVLICFSLPFPSTSFIFLFVLKFVIFLIILCTEGVVCVPVYE